MEPGVKKGISGRTRLADVGRELGETLRSGDVVALLGPKRVGKTVMARAIIEALDVKESFAPSPFVTRHSYRTGRLPVHHLNLVYLGSIHEFRAAGMDQWLEPSGVTIVEWADRIERILPEQTIRVTIDFGESPDERVVDIAHYAHDPPGHSEKALAG